MLRSEIRRTAAVDLSRWVLLHGAHTRPSSGIARRCSVWPRRTGLHYWGTVSRPAGSDSWAGDVGRVESFFESQRMVDLERRLGLVDDGFAPESAVVLVCGLNGTIRSVLVRLIDQRFIPHAKAVREALGIPAEVKDSLFYELYDPRR